MPQVSCQAHSPPWKASDLVSAANKKAPNAEQPTVLAKGTQVSYWPRDSGTERWRRVIVVWNKCQHILVSEPTRAFRPTTLLAGMLGANEILKFFSRIVQLII